MSEDPGIRWEGYLILPTSCFDYILRCPRRSSGQYIHSAFNKLISSVHSNNRLVSPVLPHYPVAFQPMCLQSQMMQVVPSIRCRFQDCPALHTHALSSHRTCTALKRAYETPSLLLREHLLRASQGLRLTSLP